MTFKIGQVLYKCQQWKNQWQVVVTNALEILHKER